jgi:outer membrane receptor protein involved in Fe transport
MSRRALLVTCALGVLGLAATAAAAQSTTAVQNTSTAGSGTMIAEVVVTAQRKQENLQSAPVAVSAFTQDSLKSRNLNGGQDLLLQIPDVNYTRSNFGGFDLKIRGIGTDVGSTGAGGTSGVSINENELPLGANHFSDTDFYDVQRVEVVRGPQGTLYGRNATGGAVNLITNQPTDQFGGYGTVSYGNYDTLKLSGAVNLPLGDAFSLRVAGIRVTSDGFGENTDLNERVDGRDLYSYRVTLRFKPSDKLDAYLMFEQYSEDDTRNRIGKQLCTPDPGPASVGGVAVAPAGGPITSDYAAFLNQGCLQAPLNSAAAYGSVNTNGTVFGELANIIGLNNGTNLNANNPLQNSNLHDIQSVIQPTYKAQQSIIDLHVAWHITDDLTLTSITGFNRNAGSTAEDYNRIIPTGVFTPAGTGVLPGALINAIFPGGVVNDPQVGASNTLRTFDYSDIESKEYTEELRLSSSFHGPLNFSAGAFYSEQTTEPGSSNYYVESNGLTAYALANNAAGGALSATPAQPAGGLLYVDPNYPPTGDGHNYYDSRNGGGFLKSYAGFGEVYYNILPNLKFTGGLRYTVDQLYNIAYPISLESILPNNASASYTIPGAGGVPGPAVGGFPSTVCSTSASACLVPQRVTYREWTGRANLDWTPTLSFTDKTLVYLSYSRGYKGGGFNTPCQASLGASGSTAASCGYPLGYKPEFINAFEVGTKNTLLHNTLTLNADAFYYDYTGYQYGTIVSESIQNYNINAKIYGVEFEGVWQPVRNLVLNANVGYLHTSIDNGQSLVDQLNLNQGDPNYTLVKETGGTNCLAPTSDVASWIASGQNALGLGDLCGGIPGTPFKGSGAYQFGIPEQLGGHDLPNSPHWTVSLGAQYTLNINDDWKATLRGDYYWQASSFGEIWNAVSDYLPSYHVVNFSLVVANPRNGIEVQAFMKNAFNAQPITGTYLTDPTSGLFTNVFTLDPRTYGLGVTKKF